MVQKDTKPNQSVGKVLHIVEALAHSPEPMRLSDLARQTQMPACTALRMINTLVEAGYAFQEDNGSHRYGLTLRFLHIGQLAADHMSIRDIAHGFLVSLARETGESCCLSIDDNGVVRYIDVVESMKSHVMIRQRIGGTAMMHCTGSGKVFLWQYDDEKLEQYIMTKGLPEVTVHTITDPKELRYELQRSRSKGYALDDEECEIGMRCLATPIYDAAQHIIATLSLSGPISRMTPMRYELELVPKLRECAENITVRIGGQVSNP